MKKNNILDTEWTKQFYNKRFPFEHLKIKKIILNLTYILYR